MKKTFHGMIILFLIMISATSWAQEEGLVDMDSVWRMAPGEVVSLDQLDGMSLIVCRNRKSVEESIEEYLAMEKEDLMILALHGIGRCRVERHAEKNCLLRTALLDPEGEEYEDFPDYYSSKYSTDSSDPSCMKESKGQGMEEFWRTLHLMIRMGLCLN